MRRTAAIVVVAAGLSLAGCGGDDDNDAVNIPGVVTARLEPAETCPGADSAEDPADDSTGPFSDLRRLELRVTRAGVCVRWTTEAQAVVGTTLYVELRGPFLKTASGALVSHNWGFEVELSEDGAEATYGLAELGSDAPNVLDARVGQSGTTVSTFVPRSELDRAPANMPDRPPFPDGALIVGARVADDAWPDDPESKAAYVGGELCGPPCPEAERLYRMPQPG